MSKRPKRKPNKQLDPAAERDNRHLAIPALAAWTSWKASGMTDIPPRTRQVRRVAGLVLALAALTLPGCGPLTTAAAAPGATADVLKTADGDTIDVRDDQRARLRVRVIGIDTPETVKPGYTVGCWGKEASNYAKTQLAGKKVALVLDPTQDKTDKYGRTLAYVLRDGTWDYGTEAVRAGMAKAYVYGKKPAQHAAAIAAAEQDAKKAGRGMWGAPCHGSTESHPKGPK